MLTLTQRLASFLAGATFLLAGLVYCGGAPGAQKAKADGTDAGAASCSCPTPVVASGTRLKARVLKSDDGAQQFLRWYDAQLDTTCAYRNPGSGSGSAAVDALGGRCIPDATAATGGSLFTDAGCSVPAGQVVTSAAPAVKFCLGRNGISPAGNNVSVIYSNVSGACEIAVSDPGSAYFECNGDPVSASDFAGMAESTD